MAVKITQTGIDTIQDDTVSSSKIVDGGIGYEDLPSGSTIQIISSIYSTRTSFTVGTSDTAVPGMTLSIIPKADNSKFKVKYRYYIETDSAWNQSWNIQRNGTRINMNGYTSNYSGITMPTQSYGGATNNSSTPEFVTVETFDETAGTTAGVPITFRLVATSTANRTCYVNRTYGSAGTTNYENGTSEVIIEEVKA